MFDVDKEKNLSSSWITLTCKGTKMQDSVRICGGLPPGAMRMRSDLKCTDGHMRSRSPAFVLQQTGWKKSQMTVGEVAQEGTETAKTRDVSEVESERPGGGFNVGLRENGDSRMSPAVSGIGE